MSQSSGLHATAWPRGFGPCASSPEWACLDSNDAEVPAGTAICSKQQADLAMNAQQGGGLGRRDSEGAAWNLQGILPSLATKRGHGPWGGGSLVRLHGQQAGQEMRGWGQSRGA